MRKSVELKKDLQTKIDAQRAIVEGAKNDQGEKRSLNADETKKFQDVQTEIDALRSQVTMAEQFEANQRASAAAAGTPVNDGEQAEEKKILKRYSFFKAVRSQMPNGKLEGVELEMHQETAKRAREAGVSISGVGIPSAVKRADGQTVTADSGAYGANLVQEDLGGVIEFLRPKPVLESLGARMLTGLQGDVAFPTNDGGIVATWETEVATVDPTKNAYGKKTMSPNRLAVNALISLQNLIQSSPDLEAMTIQDINLATAQKMDEAGINGSGSGQPEGILNASGTTTVVGGTNGAAPTWDHIVDLETAIFSNNADAATMAYLINTVTKGTLKKTKHSAGDLGYLMERDNTINGYRAGVSNLVPSTLTKGSASGVCSAGIFGDFSQLLMGQWGFYDLVVDNITRKKDGYVEITMNTFLDMLVRQPKAFAVVKDWLNA